MISPEMRAINRAEHLQNPGFGNHGGRWAFTVRDIMKRGKCESCLDYGCGKGGLKRALPDLDIREYDPCVAGKETLPEAADLVLCTDVLEHVEPDFLEEVLDHIKSVTRKYVMLAPSMVPAEKTLPDGRNAHLIIKPAAWWRQKFLTRFDSMQEDERGVSYSFFGKPKEIA